MTAVCAPEKSSAVPGGVSLNMSQAELLGGVVSLALSFCLVLSVTETEALNALPRRLIYFSSQLCQRVPAGLLNSVIRRSDA